MSAQCEPHITQFVKNFRVKHQGWFASVTPHVRSHRLLLGCQHMKIHEDTCIKWHLTESIHDEDMQSPQSPQRSVFLKFSLSKCKGETRSFRSHDREDLISSDCQLGHVGQIIPGNYFVLNQQWFKAHLDIAKLQSMYNG